MKKIIIQICLVVFVIICCVSCSPDEVDAFARGYRYGYGAELIKETDNVNPNTDNTNIEHNVTEVQENSMNNETL